MTQRPLPVFFARLCLIQLVALWLLAWAPWASAAATQTHSTPTTASAETQASTVQPEAQLMFANRLLHTMRSELSGASPEVRAQRARARLHELDDRTLAGAVTRESVIWNGHPGYSIRVADVVLFTVLQGDLDPEEKLSLEAAAQRAEARLSEALRARLESGRASHLLAGAGLSALATLVLVALIWAMTRVSRWMLRPLRRLIENRMADRQLLGIDWSQYAFRALVRLVLWLEFAIGAAMAYAWLATVLAQFAWTAPLGSRMADFVENLLLQFGDAVLGALPSLVVIVLIILVTRGVVGMLHNIFDEAASGRFQLPGLHPETATATRRILVFVAWALAFASIYPHIPGSNSDVFKGISVLFGFMLTLGSSGMVTQLMSGLVLVYSRALRVGDFVQIGDVDGVVKEVGSLSVKLATMRNEEVTIPNGVLVSNSVKNYSKLAGTQGSLISTRVTIGYDTPWRQVHALLENAAVATEGLRKEPKAFVYQRSLSDFYVEYELFAHLDQPIHRLAVLSRLHANIQDEFNSYGVQIMSPHFLGQPEQAPMVPKAKWFEAPARDDSAQK